MIADTNGTSEEARLWADYYDAVSRALEIMKAEGTGEAVLQRVAAQQALADRALARIKGIRGLGRTRAPSESSGQKDPECY